MTKMKFRVIVNGKEYLVEVEEIAGVPIATSVSPARIEEIEKPKVEEVKKEAPTPKIEKVEITPQKAPEKQAVKPPEEGAGEIVRAQLPGKITRVLVSEGQRVKAGDVVLYIEAMKMENEVVAHKDGTITKLYVKPGDSVNTDDPLFAIS